MTVGRGGRALRGVLGQRGVRGVGVAAGVVAAVVLGTTLALVGTDDAPPRGAPAVAAHAPSASPPAGRSAGPPAGPPETAEGDAVPTPVVGPDDPTPAATTTLDGAGDPARVVTRERLAEQEPGRTVAGFTFAVVERVASGAPDDDDGRSTNQVFRPAGTAHPDEQGPTVTVVTEPATSPEHLNRHGRALRLDDLARSVGAEEAWLAPGEPGHPDRRAVLVTVADGPVLVVGNGTDERTLLEFVAAYFHGLPPAT